MAATADQILQLRRLAAEPTPDTYDDVALAAYIEAYPLLDAEGEVPYTWDTSSSPPAQVASAGWIPTYDLHAAVADIWEEKAGALTTAFDFGADGATYQRSQQNQMMMAQARYHRSRRSPTSGTLIKWPKEGGAGYSAWIGNLPEDV